MNKEILEQYDWVGYRANTHPDQIAVTDVSGESLTYLALNREVSLAAGWIRELGISDGQRVAVLAKGDIKFIILAHAIPRAGGLFLPLNQRLTENELSFQLDNSHAQLLLTDSAYERNAANLVENIQTEVVTLDGAIWGASSPLCADASIDSDTAHSVIYTSGTTGAPKGALITWSNFYWSAVASAENLGVAQSDRWLACMPLFHIGGLSIILRSAIYGTEVLIHEGFDAIRVNAALREDGVTLLSVVATMLRRMLDADDDSYPSTVRAVLVGGGPVPKELLLRARERGLNVLQTYGLTETASQVATLNASDALRKLGSAGLPLSAVTLSIAASDGISDAGSNEIGEILVSGPIVTPGYLDSPEANQSALRDGWFHTGDIGYRDDEGYLYIADRRDDLIVTGGENVYPAEVEAALTQDESVYEAAVIGLEDQQWGSIVVAVIVPTAGTELDSEVIIDRLRPTLAGYKLPKRIEFTSDPLPRTASGKLQRHLVRDRMAL